MADVFRIGVYSKVFDSRAEVRKQNLHNLGCKNVIDVWLEDIYTLKIKLSSFQLTQIGSSLSNPVTQSFYIQPQNSKKSYRAYNKFSYAIEISFLPGVTDNISHTTKELIEDLLKVKFTNDEDIYSSQITFINGKLNLNEVNYIAESLYNPLIQRASIKSYQQFINDHGMYFVIPKVNLEDLPEVSDINLDVSDSELVIIGKVGIANPDGSRRGPLALDLIFMKEIQRYFEKLDRKPTDIELESLAQTWSEHCKHTIFANPLDEIKDGLFQKYIKGATQEICKKRGKKDFCVSVFSDNSGAIKFGDEFLLTHKVETHNSPSALDPFGGSITGIVGVNRDTIGFGLGAKPIANFYGFCLANPKVDIPLYKGANKTQKMLSSRRIMDGVIEGINAGGNQSGIPTPQGFIYFDERYRGKPLVFAGTVGLIPRKIKGRLSYIKKANPGDYIVMIGGRVGKDGIHGATFSSEALNEKSPVGAVQIGDPITQKKFSDALIREARNMLLYNSITDNGAGGLSCSVSEMAKESGGCRVELEKVPLKYPGLMPWEIWISESQERMTLAVPKFKWDRFSDLMKRRDIEATVIGEFTDSGKCTIFYNKKIIMDIDMQFLHYGLPKRFQKSTNTSKKHKEPTIPMESDLTKSLMSIIGRLNIGSFEFISQQYDHVVLGNSMLGPVQGRGRINADASVIHPIISRSTGVVLSYGLYPSYSDIDTYHMAAASLDTAVRNAVTIGGDPDYLAILDNFCWCSSKDSERLGQLRQSAKACFDYATVYKTPFISGKDSMFNDFSGYNKNGKPIKISIPPTLLITSIGVIKDVTEVVSLDIKFAGDLIYILGDTFEELGGSEYYKMLGEKQNKLFIGNNVPKVNAAKNKKLYEAYFKCIKKRYISAAISVNRGGLGVALAKISMGGMLGIDINVEKLPGKFSRNDFALFSESQGRILVVIAPENKKVFEKVMEGNSFAQIGIATQNEKFIIESFNKRKIIEVEVDKLLNVYRKTFEGF
ncbi:phosphoribosylformylglycinamidine synthase [Candidatus Gottesmanbacteria bacterium]|nr:phosphoribosylformylglycinamidine synthase [Candidatus Gottesmanbacteria bacterium]